jgi:hypothetical protein
VTEADKVEQHQLVQDEIYRYLSQTATYTNANYIFSDTGRTNTNGADTVVLPFKYADESYSVSVSPTLYAMVGVVVLSTDSFVVATVYPDFTASANLARENQLYRYIVIGSIE